MNDVDELRLKFDELGVPNARAWAESHVNEGIDQLSRATVLRAFADVVVKSQGTLNAFSEADWVSAEVKNAARMLEKSDVSSSDLALVTKAALYYAISDIMALLDGAAELENNPGGIQIGLVRLDEKYEPSSQIHALHESWGEVASTVIGREVVR